MTINEDFMTERKKLREQKARPYDSKFNLPQANLLSTYRDHFPTKPVQFDTDPNIKPLTKQQTYSLADGKVTTDSTYRRNFEGKRSKLPDLAEWD